MTKKKKTLPANFNELIEAKDLDALKAVFNECELNAYDRRSFKTPALSFYKIPLELMDWLIAQGADINAKDNMGAQCDRAYTHNGGGYLPQALKAIKIYLNAGLKPTEYARERLTIIGEDFEFRRADTNSEWLEEADASLQELYILFDVPPVPRRIQHDGKLPIVLAGDTWEERYEQAWILLVSSKGSASTVQGEVVRIAGRVNDELLRNAMSNWDKEYRKMITTISGYLTQGNPLTEAELTEVANIQKHILEDDGIGTHRLCELTTAWVVQNPQPIAFGKVNYKY